MRRLPACAMASFAIAAAAAGSAHGRAPVASLCRPDEPRLFACPIGRKIVSVCGRGAAAIYRFGRPGHVELEARGPTLAQVGYAGGGEAQLAFSSRGYTYVVYDSTVRTRFTPDGRHDAAITQGLMVVKDGRVLSDRVCRPGGDPGLPATGYDGMAAGAAVDH